MSNLFNDLDIEVVRLTLVSKLDGSIVDYLFAVDYWAPGTVYTTNPTFYPLLAGSPKAQRGVDTTAGIKYSNQIQLYGDSHFMRYGTSLMDVLKTYEIHNANVQILYYSKPFTPGVVTTHSDSVNIRQVMKVVGSTFDEATGVLSLSCADMLFKDKEVSKRLSSNFLPGLDPNWKGEYGSVVFGQSTNPGDGIAIDAPYFASSASDDPVTGVPTAKLFCGWCYPGQPNGRFLQRVFVKNPDQTQNKNQWVVVALEPSPQFVAFGEGVLTPAADPPNWPRDLTRYKRAIVNTPGTDAAKILTAVGTYLKVNTHDRCAVLNGMQFMANTGNPGALARGDGDFSIEIWCNFNALHDGTLRRIICEEGSQNKRGKLEWQLFFNTADDKPTFGISNNGTSIGTGGNQVKWSANVSTGQWYAIYCIYDATNNHLRINVNAGTTVISNTTIDISEQTGGIFSIGSRSVGAGAENLKSLDGKVKYFRYWSRALNDGDIFYLYNSGVGLTTDSLDDYRTQDREASNELNDPFGVRYAIQGSLDLTPNTLDASVASSQIGYDYASFATITPGNKYGEISVVIDEAETLNAGTTSTTVQKDRNLAKAVIDVTTPALATGTTAAYFQIDPPAVLAPNATYTTILDMDNADTNTYFALCAYEPNAGSTHQALDKRTKQNSSQPQPNWVAQPDVRLDLRHYYLGYGDGYLPSSGSAPNYYAYLGLQAKQITLSTGQHQKTFIENLEFKACVTGIVDQIGFYTGHVIGTIEKPSDIALFTLCDNNFGLGMGGVPLVDVTSFQQARTDCAATYANALKMQIVINSQTSAEEFMLEICRQSRHIFYKKKDGTLAMKFPRYTTTMDYTFTESYHRGDFQLLAVADNDYSTVLNDFDQLYNKDSFYLPQDSAANRLNPTERLANEIVLNTDTATSGDNDRRLKCAASEALYGKRQYRNNFSYYDSATWAQPVQNYYCDRYSTLQKRATFRVPRRTYYNSIELFSMIRIQHTAIADANGTVDKGSVYSSGNGMAVYDEGVPGFVWAGGQLEGQVYEIEEEGPWLTVTIETVSGYR